MKPKRIQRKRAKGWKMPPNTIYVGRPAKWGNPYTVENSGSRARAVELYQDWLTEQIEIAPENLEEIRRELGGKNLACWCPLDQPCHVDALLRLANE
jgi:hypothetical protein